MLSTIAAFYGVHMSARGHPRLGAGIVCQQEKGLRPSELLGLRPSDVLLPEFALSQLADCTTISLGTRKGTKAKRAQLNSGFAFKAICLAMQKEEPQQQI